MTLICFVFLLYVPTLFLRTLFVFGFFFFGVAVVVYGCDGWLDMELFLFFNKLDL